MAPQPYAVVGDEEDGMVRPRPWSCCEKCIGAGQYEIQGLDTWTEEEQKMWARGELTSKFGLGQVSIRRPVRHPLTMIALLYGFLPYVLPIGWFIWLVESLIVLGKPRFFPTYGLCVSGSLAGLNELIIKQVCKRCLPQSVTARPEEAVCKHPGMPSGHTMNAYVIMTWCFMEAMLSKSMHPGWMIIILVVMLPVPWARVYNKDHTWLQVCVSSALGIAAGVAAYFFRAAFYPGHWQPWQDPLYW
eukprot:NODE_14699_length_1092_cov_4.561658.p1 GENE.NODE_14699_length_1092_cov_4.561658~~NODE_14699_length_1092_cov_4.561658.p1  ORF type:complete len:245 (-),score=66.01 NODE_14699_length_1092_cov_4.561658:281-1015(-)